MWSYIIVMSKHIPSAALGSYGLKLKVQPFYTEALIYLLPVQALLQLFWHDRKLLSQDTDPFTLKSRHCQVHVDTVGGEQGLGAELTYRCSSTTIHLKLKFSVQKDSDFQLTPWTMKTASQRSRHQLLLHRELLWDSEVSVYVRDTLKCVSGWAQRRRVGLK